MRKYLVRVSETMTTEVEIWADNATEAEEKAVNIAMDYDDSDYSDDEIRAEVITDFD